MILWVMYPYIPELKCWQKNTIIQLYLFYEQKEVKRGYYKCEVLAENPREFKDYEINRPIFTNWENENPEFYFWTHKRFKHMGKS